MSSKKSEKNIDVYTIPTVKPVEKTVKDSCWHINRESWRFKVHFFLYLAALGSVSPYVIVFAKDRVGLSASSLGVVLTSQMFVFIFTKPMIGYLADYFNKLKPIIVVLTVITAVCNFLLLTIPQYKMQQSGSGDQTGHSNLSMYVADIDLCGNLRDLLRPNDESRTSDASSAFEVASIPLDNQVFVACFQESGDTLSCLKQCSNTRKMVGISIYDESQSLCEIIIFRDPKFFNESDCSVKCIWDKNILCHPKYNLSSPIECMKQICLLQDSKVKISLPTATDGLLSDCIDFEDLESLCKIKNATAVKSNNELLDTVHVNDATTYEFWVFTILFMISSVNINGIFTLSDTACFETIQRTGSDFGRQRLWGAIGWGTSATISGYINDFTGDYLCSWIAMGVLYVLFLWNMTKLDLVKPHFSKNILKDVGSVFKSREFIAFEVSVLLNGMGTSMIWYYLIWFLSSIGGSKLLCGLSLTVQSAFGVIPFMFFSGWVIRKVGHFNCLTLAMAAYFVRFLWYSYLQNPWLVLPIEFLHGVSYGLYYAVLASYGKLSAKPGTEATTQAIIFSTHEGLGSGLGCVLAGLSFDSVGGHQTFYYASLFSACGVVISLICSLLVDNRKGEMNVTTSTEEIHPTQKGVQCSKFKKSQLDI